MSYTIAATTEHHTHWKSHMATTTSKAVDLLSFTARLHAKYENITSAHERKSKGQVFTSSAVARFMAGFFAADKAQFRLLDAGAGIGVLATAVCERFLRLRSAREVEIHLYENDPGILRLLEENMKNCQEAMRAAGHSMSYRIISEDFILEYPPEERRPLFFNDERTAVYDGAILNPPYFKINKASPYARAMEHIVHGQPNIYALFLASAAERLRPRGTLVAITPRSFCNGLYFRGFRRWFFERMSLRHVHVFQSRTHTFKEANVLQESIISVCDHVEKQSDRVTITSSFARDFGNGMKGQTLPASSVIDDTCGDLVIRIPETEEDAQIINHVESWPRRFSQLGLRISTGPVVTFRTTGYLLRHPNGQNSVPLLSVHNVKPFVTIWPVEKGNKPTSFRVSPDSMKHLVPTKNYVLVRRFSAKEEARRLTASCFLRDDMTCPFVALENHLNYVYHAERDLTADEVFGIAALFNSLLLDKFFRTISGNTQVNATEVRTMKFPELDSIARIGKRVRRLRLRTTPAVEAIVVEELGFDPGTIG